MPKLKTYAELAAEYPWLDRLLKTDPEQACVMMYEHGGCDEIRRVFDQLALKRDWAAFEDKPTHGIFCLELKGHA